MKKFDAIFDRIIGVMFVIACTIVIFQTAAVAVNTLMRYFLNRPTTGVESFTEFGILYIAFLGAAWLLRNEKHITVDLVINSLNPKARAFLLVITSFVSCVICLVIVWYGFQISWDHWVRGVSDPFKLFGFPKATVLVIIPIGSFFFGIQFFRRALSALKRLFKREADVKLQSETPY